MSDDGYRVVFDASEHWPPLWFALPGFLFIAISRAIWRNRASTFGWHWPFDTRPRLRAMNAGCMLAFSVFLTSAIVLTGIWDYASTRRLLATGQANVVEGVVSNFGRSGKTQQRFEVGGVTFEYSRSDITPTYSEFSGAFGNGSQVRLHYTQRRGRPAILKFELYEGVVCR